MPAPPTPKQWIQQGRDEVQAGLHGHHHARLQGTGAAQEGGVHRWRRGPARHIVDLDPEQVPQAMGEERPGDARRHHGRLVQATDQIRRRQQSRQPQVRLAMQVDKVHPRHHRLAQPPLQGLHHGHQGLEPALPHSGRGAGDIRAVAPVAVTGVDQQAAADLRRFGIGQLVMKDAGVPVQADDAGVRRQRLALAGCRLVGQTHLKLAAARQEGPARGSMPLGGPGVGLLQAEDLIGGLASSRGVQAGQQVRRVVIAGHTRQAGRIPDHRQPPDPRQVWSPRLGGQLHLQAIQPGLVRQRHTDVPEIVRGVYPQPGLGARLHQQPAVLQLRPAGPVHKGAKALVGIRLVVGITQRCRAGADQQGIILVIRHRLAVATLE